jgi:F-type H+-transporting ATPase subunit delta
LKPAAIVLPVQGTIVAKEETIVSGMAGRYAQALFQLAGESNATDAVAADLDRFAAMVAESSDLQHLVMSPVFSVEQQVKALDAILSRAQITGLAANFLKLVASKRRLFAVSGMIRGYKALNDVAKGVTRAEVIVAEPLSDSNLAALQAALVQASHGRSVQVDVKVDPSIIGGLIVKLGSRMVDGSLKTKLNSIRTRMKEVG